MSIALNTVATPGTWEYELLELAAAEMGTGQFVGSAQDLLDFVGTGGLSAMEQSRLNALVRNIETAPRVSEFEATYRDGREAVRVGLAENPKTPASILEKLFDDTRVVVRCGLAANPSTPPKTLWRLFESTTDWRIHVALASNPNLPRDLRNEIARDGRDVVQAALANPGNTPNPARTTPLDIRVTASLGQPTVRYG